MHLLHHHHAATISFNSSSTPSPKNGLLYPYPDTSLQNPSFDHFIRSVFSSPRTRKAHHQHCSILSCRGVEAPLPKRHLYSLSLCNASVDDDERLSNVGISKDIDVATLGNLCVDIVLNVPKLPPKPVDQRKSYLDELSKSPPPKVLCVSRKYFVNSSFLSYGIRILDEVVMFKGFKIFSL